MRVQADGKWYVGPFDTEAEAEQAETRLVQIGLDGGTPPIVLAAVAQGVKHLAAAPGFFEIRVDGGPGMTPTVDYAAGGKFRHPVRRTG